MDTTKLSDEDIKKLISATVLETLTRMGMNADDPLESQADFRHLRAWRKSTEAVGRQGLFVAIGILVTGLAGLIWQAVRGSGHSP